MAGKDGHLVVVGHGMVGQRLVEKARTYGWAGAITIIGDEPWSAYDRVRLTSYFETYDASRLALQPASWFSEHDVRVVGNDAVVGLDVEAREVRTQSGEVLAYDELVLATGSYAWQPPIKGKEHGGVFVYRTVGDLEEMVAFTKERKCKSAAVLGGGLLGLEAANVCQEMGLATTVVDHGEWFMGRQLDGTGGKILVDKIRATGATPLLGHATDEIVAGDDGFISKMRLSPRFPKDGEADSVEVEVDLLIIATGIRPRDELGALCPALEVHPRGGFVVDNSLRTSVPHVFAVGECALHKGMCYGIVAPGYEMADVVAHNLCEDEDEAQAEAQAEGEGEGEGEVSSSSKLKSFTKGDLNTKLKLAGVDVASFGEYQAGRETEEEEQRPEAERTTRALQYHDPFSGTYRKLVFSMDGTLLLGGILVGDASDFAQLAMTQRGGKPLKTAPHELIVPPSQRGGGGGGGAGGGSGDDFEDGDQICSCNDVSKGDLVTAFKDKGCDTVAKLGKCTGAGTGCGACKPLVLQVLNSELTKAGVEVTNFVCEHLHHSRAELYHICKVKKIKTFAALMDACCEADAPKGGCGVCKPTAASIFASLWNEQVTEPHLHVLQDTNDKFLANVQRGGSFSVVPRMAGGEVTPDGLILVGQVAKDYGLYTKITGGQRVDLFGAKLQDLPVIWERLIEGGFESGHAYGKSLRTVKSCVGSTWCRYGMRDAVGMAIRLENRYKGVRSPHKLKGGVSGCLRECAEAMGKDFGLIAVEGGYNVYVCGNGGSKPRHGTLLASAVDDDTAILYIDRFLAFYIATADRLQRTARWLEQLDGGIDYLKKVVLDDSLGICEELETQMQFLVDTYRCEWTEVVNDEERRKLFRPFVNAEDGDNGDDPTGAAGPDTRGIEFVDQRGQRRPADWPKDPRALPRLEVRVEPDADAGADEEVEPQTEEGSEGSEGAASVGEAAPEPDCDSEADGDGDRDEESKSTTSSQSLASSALMADAEWHALARIEDVPKDGGAAVVYGSVQIAIFNFTSRGSWHATQNMCPNRNSFILSRGFLEEGKNRAPTVLDPLHKVPYSLATGRALNDSGLRIRVFPVRAQEGLIYVKLPSKDALAAVLDTAKLMVKADTAANSKAIDLDTAKPTLEW